jgi:hypothetical protein
MAENATTDSGRIVKMEVDYSSTCDEKIPECQKLAKEGKIHDALDTLLALEKQTRTVSCLFVICLECVAREFVHIMHKHCLLRFFRVQT